MNFSSVIVVKSSFILEKCLFCVSRKNRRTSFQHVRRNVLKVSHVLAWPCTSELIIPLLLQISFPSHVLGCRLWGIVWAKGRPLSCWWLPGLPASPLLFPISVLWPSVCTENPETNQTTWRHLVSLLFQHLPVNQALHVLS